YQTDCGDRPLYEVFHAQLGEPVAGMQDQRDHRWAYAVKDRGHRPKVAEKNVQRTQRGDDYEIWQNESPSASPRSPKTAEQIGNVDAHLDGERPGQGLADCDGFTHLLIRQPSTLRHQLPLHLSYKSDWSAKPKQAQAQKVDRKFADTAGT